MVKNICANIAEHPSAAQQLLSDWHRSVWAQGPSVDLVRQKDDPFLLPAPQCPSVKENWLPR